jgi:hypothetical protein
VTPVLLFVNASPTRSQPPGGLPQALLQFHGDETPEQCAAAGRPYLRAARMAPGFDLLDFALRFHAAPGPAARRPCRGLRWRRKGIRLVTDSTKRAPSGRFVWWVESGKRDRWGSARPALGR